MPLVLVMERAGKSSCLPRKVISVDGSISDFGLMTNPASRSAAAAFQIALAAMLLLRAETRTSPRYTCQAMGIPSRALDKMPRTSCWHITGEYFQPNGRLV